MNKIFFVIVIVVLGIFVFLDSKTTSLTIPDEAIRLRVVPNSNSEYDQEIKEKVSNNLQSKFYELLKDTKGVDQARDVISKNLVNINNTVNNTLAKENYQLGYTINYGKNYFPEKKYKGITYDEGEYEAVLVTLGSGKGDNWWCVLFPPLCLLEAEESTEEVEYKFWFQEIIEKYF